MNVFMDMDEFTKYMRSPREIEEHRKHQAEDVKFEVLFDTEGRKVVINGKRDEVLNALKKIICALRPDLPDTETEKMVVESIDTPGAILDFPSGITKQPRNVQIEIFMDRTKITRYFYISYLPQTMHSEPLQDNEKKAVNALKQFIDNTLGQTKSGVADKTI